MSEIEDRLWRLAVEVGGYRTAGRARFRCEEAFAGVDLQGKAVLEIGAGTGIMSAFAAARGASRVVALEPAATGSTEGAGERIQKVRDGLGVASFEVRAETLQAYQPGGARYDVVLLYNSINHLDEEACMRLHRSEDARRSYRAIFGRIAALCNAGAHLVIADCSRYNAWNALGLRNPIMPTIEWFKHQSPATWRQVIEPQGFRQESLRWYQFHAARRMGRLTANGLVNYFLASHFSMAFAYRPGAEAGPTPSAA